MRLFKNFADYLNFRKSRSDIQKEQKVDLDLLGIAKSEQYVDDIGVVQTRLVFTTDYVPSSELRVSDFALQNLLAAGVQLQQVGSLDGSVLSDADRAIDGVEQLNSSKDE